MGLELLAPRTSAPPEKRIQPAQVDSGIGQAAEQDQDRDEQSEESEKVRHGYVL